MTLEICRICGSKTNLKHIFQEGDDELLDQIRLCANIHIDALDSLPKFVCGACEHGLAFSYRLRKRGEETEKKLREELLGQTRGEPYQLAEENRNNIGNGYIFIEELQEEEELWIKDEVGSSVPFNDDHDFLDHVEDSDEGNITKDSCDESEQWIGEEDVLTENDETIKDVDVKDVKVELHLMKETDDSNSLTNELDHTGSQIEADTSCVAPIWLQNKTERIHCELCPKAFTTISHFNVHKMSHSKEKSFTCEICCKKMRYQGNLRVHMRTIHSNLTSDKLEKSAKKIDHNKSSSTTQCLATMSSDCQAITEVYLYDKCKVFKCTVCDKISNFKATHIAHCRIHLNEKPFRCQFCDKSFRQLATLKEHELIHLEIRKFKCSICSSSFIQKSALVKHVACHTGRKPFECSICDGTFRDRYALSVHERIHTGEKPYSCDICAQTFRENRQLMGHRRGDHWSIQKAKTMRKPSTQ